MNQNIIVIGAGLAGTCVAYELAQRGNQVTLLDRAAQPASGASGIPMGILMPFLADIDSAAKSVYAQGFQTSLNWLQRIEDVGEGNIFERTGAIQIPRHRRLKRLFDSNSELDFGVRCGSTALSQKAGIQISEPGFWVMQAGCVRIPDWIRWMLQHQAIDFKPDVDVTELQWDKKWRVKTRNRSFDADAVVIANARDHLSLQQSAWLPGERVRGQVVYVKDRTSTMNAVVCGDGYVTPSFDGIQVIGASFDHGMDNMNVNRHQNLLMLKRVQSWLPDFQWQPEDCVSGRVGFRFSTPDRLPIVGQLPRFDELQSAGERAISHFDPSSIPYYEGLYVSLGHASRGTLTCPLAAEILADLIDQPAIAPGSQFKRALEPIRFLRRALIQSNP